MSVPTDSTVCTVVGLDSGPRRPFAVVSADPDVIAVRHWRASKGGHWCDVLIEVSAVQRVLPVQDDEALGALRDEVNAYRDRSNHFRLRFEAAQHVHFARVEELSSTLTQLGDSLASTEPTEDNARLLRDFASFRKAMQLRLSSLTEQVEALNAHRQQANATVVTLNEGVEASRKLTSRLMSRLRQRSAQLEQTEEWLLSMAVRTSELRQARKRANAFGVASCDDLAAEVNAQIESGEFDGSIVVDNETVGRCVLVWAKAMAPERVEGCRVLAPAPVVVLLRTKPVKA